MRGPSTNGLAATGPARTPRRGVSIGNLQWAVGGFCTLIGALMLLAPHHFGPTYTALSPHPTLWAGIVLLAGASLLGVAALAPRRSLTIGAHLLAGAVLLAFGSVTLGGWTRTLNYGALGLGTAVAPFLVRGGHRSLNSGADLFALLMGTASTLTGLIALVWSEPFGIVAPATPPRWYGAATLVGGLALLATQAKRGLPGAAVRGGYVLAAGATIAYLFAAPPGRAWGAITYYGGFGTLLAVLPWLGPRLGRIDPASLRTRLAFALAVATALPLTVGLAIDAHRAEHSARVDALAVHEVRAVALARHVADVVELDPAGAASGRVAALLDRSTAGNDAYIVDDRGRLVAQPRGTFALDEPPDSAPLAALLAAENGSGSLGHAGRTADWLVGYARVPGPGWWVVEASPRAVAGQGAANDLYFGLLVLLIVVAASAGALAARWLAAPLDTLSRAVATLRAGSTSAPLPRSPITEVAHLVAVFGDLRDRLAARTAERERVEAERARLLEEIERERAVLAGTMAGMSDGLVVVSAAHEIRYCNARAGVLVGVDPGAVIGEQAGAAFERMRPSFRDPDAVLATWDRALADCRQRPSFEMVTIGPPDRDVLVQLFPVADVAGTGQGVGMLLHDVTAERELQRTKDELVSVVSHELRTPLGSVVGFAELLLMREWPEAQRHHFLSVMVEEGRRLTAIVNDFLDLQRIGSSRQSVTPRPTDPRPILEQAVAGLDVDPLRPVVVDLSDDLPAVQADADRIRQVLTNLLSNARKYSPEGGEVRLAARATGGAVEVTVSDRGLGIPPDALPRVFDKFYRVDSPDRHTIKGTGLGLAIVKEIVAAHGGRTWAESAGPGRGSCFGFTLRLAQVEQPSAAPGPSGGRARAARKAATPAGA